MNDIAGQDIEKGLRRMGLGEGDIVLLHSSLASLGRVEGGASAVIDAFLNVLGEDGTLVVPTFGALGVITESLRKRPDATESVHPKASVAAVGAAAEAICRNHWRAELAHGPDTPYTRIAEMGGYVCLLGVDQDRNTTLHAVEEILRLPYLRTTPEVTFDTPDGTITRSWEFFPGPHRDFIGIDQALRDKGVVKMTVIGQAVVRLMKSADLIAAALAMGKDDPAFALCGNPACQDCRRQRAAVRRQRYRNESFHLAAVSSLAGCYAEEIAENCLDVGIEAVEIDALHGMPLPLLPRNVLERTIETLADQQIRISALRMPCVLPNMDDAIAVAREYRIGRIVVPLSEQCLSLARAAEEAGVGLAFQNRAQSSWTVSDWMVQLTNAALSAKLAFSPAEFARAGEKPFLTSYRRRLRRFIDRVDVEDVRFDGTPRPLGKGNAEIKEILSILRCCSFAGYMVLGAGNRILGDLQTTADAFDALLDAL